MRKITKETLARLAQELSVISKAEQRNYVGGGSSAYTPWGASLREQHDYVIASLNNDPFALQIGAEDNMLRSSFISSQDIMEDDNFNDIFACSNSYSGGVEGYFDDEYNWGGIGSGYIWSGYLGSGYLGYEDIDRNESEEEEKLKRIGSKIGEGIYISSEIRSNPCLSHQMAEMFESNTFMELLSSFNRGYQNVTFKLGELGKNEIMKTDYGENKSLVITINSNAIGDAGFTWSSVDKDNVGYQHNGDCGELFSTSITHEAIHAKHMYIADEAMRECGDNAEAAAEYVKREYGDGLRDVIFKRVDGVWSRRTMEDFGNHDHQYIRQNDHGVLNNAYMEYIR